MFWCFHSELNTRPYAGDKLSPVHTRLDPVHLKNSHSVLHRNPSATLHLARLTFPWISSHSLNHPTIHKTQPRNWSFVITNPVFVADKVHVTYLIHVRTQKDIFCFVKTENWYQILERMSCPGTISSWPSVWRWNLVLRGL